MLIKHKIRKSKKYLLNLTADTNFVVGTEIEASTLKNKFEVVDPYNQVYIPKLQNGINSKRNTIGEFKPDKNKPKETAYRAQEWTLQDWGGNLHSGVSYISYLRYPRYFIPPYQVNFTLTTLKNTNSVILANTIFNNANLSQKDLKLITFTINLLIETVGSAEIFSIDKLTGRPIKPLKTVNWEILPRGRRIWEHVMHGASSVSKSEKKMIKERIEFIESFNPDEIYEGKGSYTGYLVFSFKKKNLFIFDSIMYGQATYVFKDSWEKVSKLTKKQIIENELAEERIIHSPSWNKEISRLFK